MPRNVQSDRAYHHLNVLLVAGASGLIFVFVSSCWVASRGLVLDFAVLWCWIFFVLGCCLAPVHCTLPRGWSGKTAFNNEIVLLDARLQFIFSGVSLCGVLGCILGSGFGLWCPCNGALQFVKGVGRNKLLDRRNSVE